MVEIPLHIPKIGFIDEHMFRKDLLKEDSLLVLIVYLVGQSRKVTVLTVGSKATKERDFSCIVGCPRAGRTDEMLRLQLDITVRYAIDECPYVFVERVQGCEIVVCQSSCFRLHRHDPLLVGRHTDYRSLTNIVPDTDEFDELRKVRFQQYVRDADRVLLRLFQTTGGSDLSLEEFWNLVGKWLWRHSSSSGGTSLNALIPRRRASASAPVSVAISSAVFASRSSDI